MVAGAHTGVRNHQEPMIRGLSCISIYVHSDIAQKTDCDPDTNGPKTFSGTQMANCKQSAGCPDGHFSPVTDAIEERVGSDEKGNDGDSISSCSSSIGQDSSANGSTLTGSNEGSSGDMEVQSSFKGPLDTLSSLEDSLPIKRGISNFFSGKSRSFTSLSDAVSIKDLVKPDNPYHKKRRSLLACGNNWDRHRSYPPRNTSAGISKKPLHSSKSTLALVVAMSNSENSRGGYEQELRLPPLPPQQKMQTNSACPRSFSLTDLRGVGC
eukprot:Gb_18083 [translate_table: standard]